MRGLLTLICALIGGYVAGVGGAIIGGAIGLLLETKLNVHF